MINKNKKKVLVLHFVKVRDLFKIPRTVIDSLSSFKKYSQYSIEYKHFHNVKNINLNNYAVVIVHYYSQVYTVFSSEIIHKFAQYNGLKVFFVQDDYDCIHVNREKYLKCKIDVLFTPVTNKEALNFLYPPRLFSSIDIISYFTGYCEEKNIPTRYIKPLKNRKLDIFYRGNDVGFAYGSLGMEKYNIGVDVLQRLDSSNLSLDISCKITDQIYGKKYFKKMASARATLVTESGSSILFDSAELMQTRLELIKKLRAPNSEIEISKLKEQYKNFFALDEKYKVAEISPKVFEAIICRTMIIGFRGQYSNVLKENLHYLVLEKDYSNLLDVVEKIKDIEYINQITKRAYLDIVHSGLYSYKAFISKLDGLISTKLSK